jgi:hypothetical protein
MEIEIEQKSDLNHLLTNFLDEVGRINKLRETPVLKAGPFSKLFIRTRATSTVVAFLYFQLLIGFKEKAIF